MYQLEHTIAPAKTIAPLLRLASGPCENLFFFFLNLVNDSSIATLTSTVFFTASIDLLTGIDINGTENSKATLGFF